MISSSKWSNSPLKKQTNKQTPTTPRQTKHTTKQQE